MTVLIVTTVAAVLWGLWQSHRADRAVSLMLEREEQQRSSRAELVEVFLADAKQATDRVDEERNHWRLERADLLNAILTMPSGSPMTVVPPWSDGMPEKLHRTEDDEVMEARARVAQQIQDEIDARPLHVPGGEGDVAC